MRTCAIAILAILNGMMVSLGPVRQPEPMVFHVGGVGLQDTNLTRATWDKLPHTTVTVEEGGTPTKYGGVSAQTLLATAGLAFGQSLRGPALRNYLLVQGADGYAVIFALPEVAEEFSGRRIIVADSANGAPISGRDGPFRVVVSDETKHARWVRNVSRFTLKADATDAGETKSSGHNGRLQDDTAK